MRVRYCDICCSLIPAYSQTYNVTLEINAGEENPSEFIEVEEEEICIDCARQIKTIIVGKKKEKQMQFRDLGRQV